MIEHVSSCRREHPQGKYLVKGNPAVIHVLMFVMISYVFFCDCKCKDLNRLGANIQKTRQNRKASRKTKIQDIQPRTRPRINISQVPTGKYCISVFLFLKNGFANVLYVCVYGVMCFFDCKCKRLNELGETICKHIFFIFLQQKRQHKQLRE